MSKYSLSGTLDNSSCLQVLDHSNAYSGKSTIAFFWQNDLIYLEIITVMGMHLMKKSKG